MEFSYAYWLPNRFKVLCCMWIYISISLSPDRGPSATGQENDYHVRMKNSQLGERLGLGRWQEIQLKNLLIEVSTVSHRVYISTGLVQTSFLIYLDQWFENFRTQWLKLYQNNLKALKTAIAKLAQTFNLGGNKVRVEDSGGNFLFLGGPGPEGQLATNLSDLGVLCLAPWPQWSPNTFSISILL